jgi:Mrp family chromosome partitioning ATPase
MFRRRARSPVLAEISERRGGKARQGSLTRSELETFDHLLNAVGGSRAVLATGDVAESSVALGLGAAAVVEGRRAALVECDLSRPTLAARLGLATAPGLHEYLVGKAEAPQILQPMVLAGPASGRAAEPLVCVVAGTPTADGPTLLASPAFQHAIGKLRNAYDLLVLDGPSLGEPHSLTAVAELVDATLACVGHAVPSKRLPVAVKGFVIQS